MAAWSDLVQVLFMVADDYFLIVSSHGREREREANSLRTLLRALIPLLRTPPSNLITSHRLHFLISLHWGMGFQNMNFEKTNIQSIKTHPLEQQSLPPALIPFHPLYLFSISSRPQRVPEPFFFCQSAMPILFLTHEICGSSPPSSFVPLTSCHVYPPNPQNISNHCPPCCCELLEETSPPRSWNLTLRFLFYCQLFLSSWLFSTFSVFFKCSIYPRLADNRQLRSQ